MNKGKLNISAGKLTQAGGTSEISNTVSMSGGELSVTGGVMDMTSSNLTATGGKLSISGGELVLGADSATALLGGVDSLSLTGGALDLSALSFDSAVALKENASFSFGGDGVVEFGNLAQETTYNIFTLSSGSSLSGWDSLSAANFSVNGTNLRDMGRVSLQLGDAGTFSYSVGVSKTLYWTGGSGADSWDHDSLYWNEVADGNAVDNDRFYTGDSVVFASDASVTVAEDISVDKLTVNAGKTLTTHCKTQSVL